MYPRGVSMNPLIREGKDSVTLSAVNGELNKYDVALFRVGDRYFLHRFVGRAQNGCVFCGDRCCEYESGIADERIIAVVTAIQRNGRSVRMDSLGYRTYVDLIIIKRRFRRLLLRVARKILRVFNKKK